MNREFKSWLKSFLLELVVYAVLIVGYYLLVLHLLGDWLYSLFKNNRQLYTGVALGLIIVQGVFLETMTRLLLGFIKPRTEE